MESFVDKNMSRKNTSTMEPRLSGRDLRRARRHYWLRQRFAIVSFSGNKHQAKRRQVAHEFWKLVKFSCHVVNKFWDKIPTFSLSGWMYLNYYHSRFVFCCWFVFDIAISSHTVSSINQINNFYSSKKVGFLVLAFYLSIVARQSRLAFSFLFELFLTAWVEWTLIRFRGMLLWIFSPANPNFGEKQLVFENCIVSHNLYCFFEGLKTMKFFTLIIWLIIFLALYSPSWEVGGGYAWKIWMKVTVQHAFWNPDLISEQNIIIMLSLCWTWKKL